MLKGTGTQKNLQGRHFNILDVTCLFYIVLFSWFPLIPATDCLPAWLCFCSFSYPSQLRNWPELRNPPWQWTQFSRACQILYDHWLLPKGIFFSLYTFYRGVCRGKRQSCAVFLGGTGVAFWKENICEVLFPWLKSQCGLKDFGMECRKKDGFRNSETRIRISVAKTEIKSDFTPSI